MATEHALFLATRGVLVMQMTLASGCAAERIPHGRYDIRADTVALPDVEASELFVNSGGTPLRKLILNLDLAAASATATLFESNASSGAPLPAVLTNIRTRRAYTLEFTRYTTWVSLFGEFLSAPPDAPFRCVVKTNTHVVVYADAFAPDVQGGESRLDLTIGASAIAMIAGTLAADRCLRVVVPQQE